MSVLNSGDLNGGTSSRPHSFTVAGLTGEQTFPWLFPYGHGGIGHSSHKRVISEDEHKRQLLMYYDKHFQLDLYFPMVVFNDAQIKQAKTGSHLLVDHKKFQQIADRLSRIESEVNLACRLEQGESIKNKTANEQACFELLEDLEHAGAHVQGSLATKKYMQNEVWSLISFKGAPSWFITFSPVDINHPLHLYFTDNQTKFSPALRSSDNRLKLIAQNPAAAARFFHYMSESFIKNVLGVGADRPGLYGETDTYYGTVEQQGRLTSHMHMLIWIKSALSSQEIRDRLMNPDLAFQKDLTKYLESCHVDEFLTGTMTDVKAKVSYRPSVRGGLHEVIDMEEYKSIKFAIFTLSLDCNGLHCALVSFKKLRKTSLYG